MKGSSNLVSAIHNLAQARDNFESFCREHPGSIGSRKIKVYLDRIKFIYLDFVTITSFTDEVRQAVREEWKSDAFTISAIAEKAALLTPDQRDTIEILIDQILSGEKINVVLDGNIRNDTAEQIIKQ